MVILGLLFVLVAVGAGVWLVLAGQHVTATTDLTELGLTIGFSPLALLIAGAGVMLATLIGLYLIRSGVVRGSRLRKTRKENERLAAEQRATAEAEAKRRLEQERAARPEPSITSPGPRSDVGWRTSTTDTEGSPPPPPPRP